MEKSNRVTSCNFCILSFQRKFHSKPRPRYFERTYVCVDMFSRNGHAEWRYKFLIQKIEHLCKPHRIPIPKSWYLTKKLMYVTLSLRQHYWKTCLFNYCFVVDFGNKFLRSHYSQRSFVCRHRQHSHWKSILDIGERVYIIWKVEKNYIQINSL